MREYAEKVKEILEGEGFEAEVREVVKVNDEKLVGVTIREGEYGPTLYVNAFYENGATVEECADSFLDALSKNKNPELPDIDWENIKDKLTVRLLDEERNEKYLMDKVSKPVGCGLTMIADVDLGDYRMPVTTSVAVANFYGDVIDTALKNCEERFKPVLTTMTGALGFGNEANLLEEDGEVEQMLVLTNTESSNGAITMFYKGILGRIRDIIGDAYFILPSSIHEVIIVPDDGSMKVRDLKKLVVEANRTVVDSVDVLSDKVFRFDEELEAVA